jgi:tRNA-2-methylthio-N6-dimethylallyladenosine synthase
MIKDVLTGKKYHIETMGCQMNERDSETIAGLLSGMGAEKAPSTGTEDKLARQEAQIIIVNTCSVRENADNRFFGILGQLKKCKEARPETLVAVCGCMMQQQHIIDAIRGKYSWVDIVFGTHNIHALPELLITALSEKEKIVSIWEDGGDIVEGLPARREYPFKAYVNIMYGCNNFCTYCIVPYTRGRERSRRPSDVLKEVQDLVNDGVKEIMLLGQNVNSYRGETEGQVDTNFPELIYRLNEIDGLKRIRFMTSHPKDFSDGLVAAYRDCPALCPALHLPVQSGSNRILARMNRRYTKEDYLFLIEKLRDANGDIVLTTDFIVGFPGETEADFEETMDLIEQVRFDSAFTFLFSPRKGTPAAEYEGQVPEEIKHERFNRMVMRLNAITLKKNRLYLGRTLPILIEGRSRTNDKALSGRTAGGKLVNIPAPPKSAPLIGQIKDVTITDVNTFSFIGEIASQSL